MKVHKKDETGVSPIVGEMLMLSLVLILVSLFAVSASQYIPEDREPSLNIMMEKYTPQDNDYNVTLWHKGGDTVSNRGIKIILSKDKDGIKDRIQVDTDNISINDKKEANFMPGDSMKIIPPKDVSGYTIQMVVSNSVVFAGRVEG
jgi:FlaG/FlaF family flagellin (archaellin)